MSILSKILTFLGIKNDSTVNAQQALLQKLREERAKGFPKLSDWVVDALHTSIKFRVMHMGISEVVGSFKVFEIDFHGTSPDFSDIKVLANIPVNSIQTDMTARDAHLKSADFFDAEKFPAITFQSTNITWRPLRFFTLTGNLTIKGITKPVQFEGKIINFLPKDMFGEPRIGFQITTEINRMDFDLHWQMELESKDKVVDETVKIEIHTEIATPKAIEALQNMLKQMMGN